MNLTVKTLKGEKFVVEAEASNTIAEVKAIIETARTDMKAAGMKLIHSGKILKDADTVEACNIKPTDFLVVMLTKAKKQAAAPAPAPVAAPAPAAAATNTATTTSTSTTTATTTTTTTATESASSTTTTAASTAATAATATSSEFPAEVVAGLTGMGFPQDMALACLRAAQGNPDVAVEYLTNGIPDAAAAVAASTSSTSAAAPAAAASSSSSSDPLAALRAHPQLNQLRRLVQTNPQALQAVLSQIGQQQPELLQAINANQAGFLELMNEPVVEDAAPSNAAAAAAVPPSGAGAGAGIAGLPGMGMGGMPNPADMARMLAGLSEPEINQMAGVMGLTPQQLMATAQAIGNMPPEQFQQHMMQAMQQGGMGGMGGGAGMPGQHVVRLTDEEMASVDRLTEMGFDRTEAVQAFLACDKNEALAANLLMDSMNDGGFGGGFGGGSGGGGNPEGPGDGDDMYD
eukprot:CAMPEP_0196808238 /NCGR_PEP_ID=MMETSP1362-20130617/8231_1 /TAXON_ID=163516 /ORGANISM="Leptocylindrus danicus, Strain CCMP1856" /LENGTH=459 /DNA_ID=CAMNT_0042182503 /DNA_START=83 /DNA_END=1462 /DNA_ORIENTATION=-